MKAKFEGIAFYILIEKAINVLNFIKRIKNEHRITKQSNECPKTNQTCLILKNSFEFDS
jgi:hypothetical protein